MRIHAFLSNRSIAGLLAAGLFMLAAASAAYAQDLLDRTYDLDIPPQQLTSAMIALSRQTGVEVLMSAETVEGLQTTGVTGELSLRRALDDLLAGTPLGYRVTGDRAVSIAAASMDNAAGQNTIGQRRPGIEEIIVTGQKREERIQDVPIAISAFSAEDLEAQKLEGGFDLLKAIPNVTFSKTNFTSYNFQIRGVGTQSISATSDPGVAVAFNNSAIIQNRLFEQEYLDVERVEVLRGPQGTLYGRNATAGVINVISNKPEMGVWDGMLDVEVGNYNTRRLRGHVNMPIGDTFAIRGAYASTDREGYTFNSGTGNRIDGRDLWTGRLTLGWQPNDRLRADLIYERFEENDDRLRTSKQLCHRDPGPEVIGSTPTNAPGGSPGINQEAEDKLRPALFSQGCQPGSLYVDEAFGTPNGLALPFVFAPLALGHECGDSCFELYPLGFSQENSTSFSTGDARTFIDLQDPYGGRMQSRDLREIASFRDPRYRAEADLFELNIDFDITETLQFSSQTTYVEDETYSFQDFNRFNTVPVFTDTSTLSRTNFGSGAQEPSHYADLVPGGVFCDPQVGCSDTMAGFDISQASAEQFSQEFRLQSSFAGPLNFSIGANYTEFETLVDYYVFNNLITALAWGPPFHPTFHATNEWSRDTCNATDYLQSFGSPIVTYSSEDPAAPCPYVDPNPINFDENFEGDGHNYFRSKNPYELESWAAFGELYWNIQDDLKLTLGLRYTDDQKTFTRVPSQLLTGTTGVTGGYVARGYPEAGDIEQQWGEWTGRLVLDWQPVLDFTDETLVYASFSRGYKGGGANPPTPGFATEEQTQELLTPRDELLLNIFNIELPVLQLTADEYSETFEPEFVNAYEVGTKNTLFGGAVTLNATAFYYDYTDYQVSQIRDRTAVNENFDAEMWGLELETVFVPSPNWQFLANVGYLNTKIAEGETSIDIMNRTQGDPDYTLVKPWSQLPSNCVVPTHYAEAWLQQREALHGYWTICSGAGGLLSLFDNSVDDPETGMSYDPANYPELNGGAGLLDDLGGNELPQAPRFTVTVGGQYSFDVTPEWRGTVRMDYYWQDESYHRVYNTEPYDRLKSWSNTNLSFWVNNANSGITVEAYVKNLFNQTPITGAFLNSDDTGLTTNVFMFDPRVIGVSVRKEW